jgi:peptidoglycan/LPS O-acetylase OafA/YrhL
MREDNRLEALDGWRGCAIIALLAGHFLTPIFLNSGLNAGRLGVELFFVLSGRLMAEALFVQRSDLGGWAVRRVARLVPALWFFLAAILIATALAVDWTLTPAELLSAATFTLNYTHGAEAASQLQHVWSLCVEAHTYVVMALIAWFGRSLPLRQIAFALLALAALAMICGVIQSGWLGMPYYDVYWRSDVRGASILVAAGLYLLLRDRVSSWLIAMAPLGVILQADIVPDAVKYTLGTTCLALGVCAAPHAGPRVQAVLRAAPLRWFGLASYSIYIWQQPFAKTDLNALLMLLAAIVVGAASFYLVETPGRNLVNGLARRVARPRLVSAAAGRSSSATEG